MIKKILMENDTNDNYLLLPEERKLKYQSIFKKLTCCLEEYIVCLNIPHPYYDPNELACVLWYTIDKNKVITICGNELF